MYIFPKCGNYCTHHMIANFSNPLSVWTCPMCGWNNLEIRTQNSTSTENIDLGRVTTSTEVK